jgi:hypothetical protein
MARDNLMDLTCIHEQVFIAMIAAAQCHPLRWSGRHPLCRLSQPSNSGESRFFKTVQVVIRKFARFKFLAILILLRCGL